MIIISLIIYWLYWVFRMINPFKFTGIFGKKGSGKSSLLTYYALYFDKTKVIYYDKDEPKFWKKFKKVKMKLYSNTTLYGVDYIRFDPRKLGIDFDPPEFSVLLIDEMSLFWWSRNFKSLDPRVYEWFVNQRKNKCIVIGFSQTFNIDKALRETLMDKIYLMKNFLITWSMMRQVDKQQTIKENALDASSQLSDQLSFVSPLVPGALKFFWLPKYIKYFDTNEKFHVY